MLLNQTEYNLLSCLHPVKIHNPYSHEDMFVPCGHCDACVIRRSRQLTQICKCHEEDHKYCYFVTLTYAPIYLPTIKLVNPAEQLYSLQNVRLDKPSVASCWIDNKPFALDLPSYKYALLERKTNLPSGGLGVLCKYDVRMFLKRLRRRLSYNYNIDERISYYAVGEYGPRTLRPHFHVLLYFDSEQTSQVIEKVVRESWKFGRIDISLSRGDCNKYVAGYVNSSCDLPSIYKTPKFKPFSLHSQLFGLRFYQEQKEEIFAFNDEEQTKVQPSFFDGRFISGKYVPCSVWRSLESYFFPKCYNFNHASRSELYELYTIMQKAWIFYGEQSPWNLTKEILEDGEYNPVIGILSRYIQHFQINKFLFKDVCEEQYLKIFRKVFSILHTSYVFLTRCCSDPFDYKSRCRALDIIISYYNTKQLNLINHFYENIENLQASGRVHFDPLALYNNGKSFSLVQNDSYYKSFKSACSSVRNNSVKHKILNDLNKLFIIENKL